MTKHFHKKSRKKRFFLNFYSGFLCMKQQRDFCRYSILLKLSGMGELKVTTCRVMGWTKLSTVACRATRLMGLE